jgi:hypothetical protein
MNPQAVYQYGTHCLQRKKICNSNLMIFPLKRQDTDPLKLCSNELNLIFYRVTSCSGLSDLRTQYLKCIQALKSKNSSADLSRPPAAAILRERPPQVDPKAVKLHLKKIEFYLAWAREYGSVFQS